MRKTINCKIVKLISILLFSCLFGLIVREKVFAAEDNILIYSNIYNASKTIDTEFTYEITPDATNPTGASGEPTSVTIKFDNVAPAGNLTTLTKAIDFSGTTYTKLGVYKYIVEEVSSSNSEYQVSSEKYEIYVTVTTAGAEVSQQAKNLDTGIKGNLNFNHEPEYSYITINLTVIGDEMDKQEYFRFKVFVDSLCAGCKYDVLGQDEYVRFEGNTIKTPDQYTVFAQGGTRAVYALQKNAGGATAEKAMFNGGAANRRNATYVANGVNHIYMKHGQSVTIGLAGNGLAQIPIGTLVRVMNDQDLDLRKWTMYIDGVETREFEHYVGRNVDFDIVLERNMLVPNTGLFAESLPYLLLVLLGGIGLYSFFKLKARNAE